MRFLLKRLSIPKHGCGKSDNEDACAAKITSVDEEYMLAVAISDGATASSFPAEWAKMMARAFVKGAISSPVDLRLQTELLEKRWYRIAHRKNLPWYAEEKNRMGAFATLCGVRFHSGLSSNRGTWSAIGIGDSCFFHVRNDRLMSAFPIQRSDDFSNFPLLISSNQVKNAKVWAEVKMQEGGWDKGDLFFFATDALASWFLEQYELTERPWKIVTRFLTCQNPSIAFRTWVDESRMRSQIKDDDTSLIILKFGD